MKKLILISIASVFAFAANATEEWVELPEERAADIAQAVVDASSQELLSNCMSSANDNGELNTYGDRISINALGSNKTRVFQNTTSTQPVLKLVRVITKERQNNRFRKVQHTALVTTDSAFTNVTSIVYSFRQEIRQRRLVNKGTILEPDYQPGSVVQEFFYKDSTCELP